MHRGQSEAASAQPLHSDRRTAENLVRNEVRSFLNEAAPDIAIDDFLSGDVGTNYNLLFMEALASVSQEYVLYKAVNAEFISLSTGRRTWATSNITKEKRDVAVQLKEVGQAIAGVSSIRLPESQSLGTSRVAIMKKELMKEVVVQFKCLEHSMARLESRLRCRVAQLRQIVSATPKAPPT